MIGGFGFGSFFGSGFRNRLINGDMRIDQRNVGAAITPVSSNIYSADRWFLPINQSSKITVQQVTTAPPANFDHYLKFTVAAAVVAPAAGDFFGFQQNIEGNNIPELGWGTVNAKTVALSFWVQSSVAGTYTVSLRNAGGNQNYLATYSIPVANVWTFISLVIPGDTTASTWATDNTAGILLNFDLGSGATFTGTANIWQAGNLFKATGSTNWISTAAATFQITGVQFEVASAVSAFAVRPFTEELLLCQRYYEKWNATTKAIVGTGHCTSTTTLFIVAMMTVQKRVSPTLTASGTIADFILLFGGGSGASNALPIAQTAFSPLLFGLQASVAAGLTLGQGGELLLTATATLEFSAEL